MITLFGMIVVFLGYLPRLQELAELHRRDKAEGLYEDEEKRKREPVEWLRGWMIFLAVSFAADMLLMWVMFHPGR